MKVIEVREEVETCFGIGHNVSSRETFLPNMCRFENDNLVYIDTAGFDDDSTNQFLSLIKSFIFQYIL